MAPLGTDTHDLTSLLDILGPQMTAEQAMLIFQQGQEAVVFSLLNLSKQLSERQAGLPTGIAPSAQGDCAILGNLA